MPTMNNASNMVPVASSPAGGLAVLLAGPAVTPATPNNASATVSAAIPAANGACPRTSACLKSARTGSTAVQAVARPK
jgi:hypothetical protein